MHVHLHDGFFVIAVRLKHGLHMAMVFLDGDAISDEDR